MKKFQVKEHIFRQHEGNIYSLNLWNCEGLQNKNFVRLCATFHTIQSLLVHKSALQQDFQENDQKIVWHNQMTFITFIGLQTFKVKLISENSLWHNILNHFQTKVTPKNPHSGISFSVILKKWEFWQTYFF